MNSERLKMIDLFSGAGGLSEGLSEAGFHSLFASEIVPVYAQTYKKNHPDTNVFTADIRTLDANEVRTTLGIERGELDLIAGGPPCQGFSINAPVRTTLDERNHLFKEYLRFVDAFAPRAVLIENVPGLVSLCNAPCDFERFSRIRIWCRCSDSGCAILWRSSNALAYHYTGSTGKDFTCGGIS